jgi:hypothetical protein
MQALKGQAELVRKEKVCCLGRHQDNRGSSEGWSSDIEQLARSYQELLEYVLSPALLRTR